MIKFGYVVTKGVSACVSALCVSSNDEVVAGADYPFQPERYEWRNGVSVIGSWQVACLYV